MKLICISGNKHSKKDVIAFKLANCLNGNFIKPYTDKKVSDNSDYTDMDDYIHLNENQLSEKMEREIPLAVNYVNGCRYVFFETQLRGDYVVLIGDDTVVTHLKKNYTGKLCTVKCLNGSYSERNILPDNEFDIIFDSNSDVNELVELIKDE